MLFEIFCYVAAIVAVLWFVGEPIEATPAPGPVPDVDLPSLPELLAEAEALTARPVPAIAAEVAAPVAIAVVEVAAIDYRAMTSQELRKECSRQGIRWRGVREGGKHLTKPQMLEALGA